MLSDAVKRPIEVGVFGAELLDLVHGVHDRGVMLVVEVFSDVGKGEFGQLLAEVHRDLPGKGDLLGVVPTLDLADLETVVTSYELDDLGCHDPLMIGRQDVFEGLLGQFKRERLAGQRGEGDDPVEHSLELTDIGLDLTGDYVPNDGANATFGGNRWNDVDPDHGNDTVGTPDDQEKPPPGF